jgi:hypothetical protein
LLKYIIIIISLFTSISITSVYSQELKEYQSELIGIKLEYPEEWEENMQEHKSEYSDDNHRSISFGLVEGEGALTVYVHNTKQDIKNLNQLMLNNLNLLTSTGSFAIKFFELNQNSTFAGLPAVKIVNDQNFMLGNDPNLTTLMQTVALSKDGSNTYGVTYRIDKPYFEEYLPTVEKIIESIEIINN